MKIIRMLAVAILLFSISSIGFAEQAVVTEQAELSG